jgi:cystathionine beta-synthase
VKTDDNESLIMARRLIREEGLLCGGSSGSAVAGALRAAKALKPGQRCVVLLPDSIRNYMTKHLNDNWMWRMGFVDAEHHVGVSESSADTHWWCSKTVADLRFNAPVTVSPDITVGEAVDILQSLGYDQLPVVGEDNAILGVVTEGNMTTRLMSGRVKPGDSVTKALFPQFRRVTTATPLFDLARIFDRDHFAVVVQTQRTFRAGKEPIEKSLVTGVVTRIDLLKYVTDNTPASPPPAAAATGGAGKAAGCPVAHETGSSGAAAAPAVTRTTV